MTPLTKYAINALRLIKAAKRISGFNNPKSSLHKNAATIIETCMANCALADDTRITDHLKNKMKWYMTEYVYVGLSYARLIDISLSTQQIRGFYLSGILIAICDYLIDDTDTDITRLHTFKSPQNLMPCTDIDRLYLYTYQQFVTVIPAQQHDRCLHYYHRLFDAQILSKKQVTDQLDIHQVDAICKEKSGANMLFLRALISQEWKAGEESTWVELGGFIQYCNDVQDSIKDTKNKVSTFATNRSDYKTVLEDLDAQRVVAFKKIKALDYPMHQKSEMLFELNAMYRVILSKVRRLSKLADWPLTSDAMADLKANSINLKKITLNQVMFALPRILRFEYNEAEHAALGFRGIVD